MKIKKNQSELLSCFIAVAAVCVIFGAKKLAVLYGFALVGHQIGAFASASLGGVFVKAGMGYAPLWTANMCLAAAAAAASYCIRE